MKKVILITLISAFLISCEKMFILATPNGKPTIELKNGRGHINGILGKTFYKKFKKFTEDNPTVKDLVLEKIPGSANDEWNVKACLLLNEKGMNTEVTCNSVIESGGVDLFISGNKRIIEKGAKIGVHSWREGKKDGSEFPKESKEHDIFIDFFEKIGMNIDFYWFTLIAAPGNGMHFMTEAEIELYGLEKP